MINISSHYAAVSHYLEHRNTGMDMQNSKPPRRRAPRGVDPREVAMRLMPEERKQFDELANQFGISDGAMSREVYLAGLPVWLAQQQQQAAA